MWLTKWCCVIFIYLFFPLGLVNSPLTTPEQAQQFLAAMRDKSKKEGIDHKPPSNLSADGVDAWYMMQRHREQELRQRRKEAAEILRGYRAPYQHDDHSVEWGTSPTYNNRRSRASFGDANLSESLTDPASPAFRRQSAMPRMMEHDWDQREDSEGGEERFDHSHNHHTRRQFPSERTDFLREQPKTYSNEQYDRTVFTGSYDVFGEDDPNNFFSPDQSGGYSFNTPSLANARKIDTTPSQNRLRDAEEKKRRSSSGDAGGGNNNEAEPQLPETVWRDFISPGKFKKWHPSLVH